MDSRQFKLLVVVFLILSIFTSVIALRSGSSQKPSPSLAAPLPIINPVRTPVPSQSLPTVVGSPDGKATLSMTKKNADGNVIWTLSVDGTQILNETLPQGTNLSIPANTFSPDNKYIFLKETGSGLVSYPVLSTNGASLSKNDQAVEIVSLFSQKYPNYTITDVTGWGGMSLIVVNTDKTVGGQGPSFWFDVASRSFIQLSTRFN